MTEGQFTVFNSSLVANGRARIITESSVYTGTVKMGRAYGQGIFKYGNKTQKGFWNAGKYFESKVEFDLAVLFRSAPKSQFLKKTILQKWLYLEKTRPFQLQKLSINDTIQVTNVSTIANETEYSGQNALDAAPVAGRLTTPAKLVEGQMVKNEMGMLENGYVRVIYENGTRNYYEGLMSKGKYHGQGTLHLNNGTKVPGYWQNGTNYNTLESYELEKLFNSTPSSNLSQALLDSWSKLGAFKFKTYMEEGKLLEVEPDSISQLNLNSSIYVGQVKNGKANGFGRMQAKGILQEGFFIDSTMFGYGRVITEDSWYLGNYSQGQKHGYGKLTYSDGKTEEGFWQEDALKPA